jgi:lipoprotein-anchoring transpeptidase ErfK/SrfK
LSSVLIVRVAASATLAALVVVVGLGAANAHAFDARAAAMERAWRADEAAGVPADQLASARAQLSALRTRHVGPLPYAAYSGAVLTDPFTGLDAQVRGTLRRHAADSLAHLRQVAGPNFDARTDEARLAAARHDADLLGLARAWDAEAKQLADARDRLAAASGGLSDGLPRDVVDEIARLQALSSNAAQARLSTDPAGQAAADAQAYLRASYPEQLARHADLLAEVRGAADKVQHRMDVRATVDGLAARLPDLLAQASKYGLSGSYQSRATQAGSDLDAAESAQDDGRMDGVAGVLQQLVDDLQSAVSSARRQAAIAAGCLPDPPADKVIIIHLATQQLIAYDNGCPFVDTLVTTGRPAVRTDRGTFHVQAKFPSYLMHSPWPKGDPLWYPDTTVYNAMEFNVADGSFIHSAAWQPASTYGPGSENGPYASHGCVHVMDGPLQKLYDWAPVGTLVIIGD